MLNLFNEAVQALQITGQLYEFTKDDNADAFIFCQ